jgi:O-antigen ligase
MVNKYLLLCLVLMISLFIGILASISVTYIITISIFMILFFLTLFKRNYLTFISICLIVLPINDPIFNINLGILLIVYISIVSLILKDYKAIKITKLDVFPLLYLIMGLFPIINAGSFSGWFNGYLENYLIPILFYFHIKLLLENRRININNLIFSLVTSINILSMYALIQFIYLGQEINYVGDAAYKLSGSILSQGNGLAMNIEFIYPYLIFLLAKKKNSYLVISLIFNSIILFMTLSRGAWIAIVAFLFMYLLYKKRFFLVTFIMFIFGASLVLIEPVKTRMFTDLSTFLFRKDLWALSLNIIKNNFFFGIPVNDFHKYYELELNTIVSLSRNHNVILDFIVFNGIIGGIFLFLFCVILIKNFLRLKKFNINIYDNINIFYFIFLIILLHGQIDSPLFSLSRDVFFWISFSIYVTLNNITRGKIIE